ncbi:MAG: hypothetical protein O6763_04525 [Gammaproteobacteria bacterium]|nr:hypothetical protein [Gammaproteobacteria bacterium]
MLTLDGLTGRIADALETMARSEELELLTARFENRYHDRAY